MTTDKKPDRSLKDTGERMIPAYHKSHMVYGEHIVRYEAAGDIVKDKVVLDIASGSGYGTSHLAQSAKKVYGVDVDKDAIAYAKKNYAAKNIEFVLGDGTKIPLADNLVDVIVSFETIEHIENYETFMKEVSRVLKPDGLLILSTPNDVEFPETNHFHIHEFEKKELEGLVAKYFKHTKSYFQGTWLYNALLDETKLSDEWEEQITTIQTAPIKTSQCIYFYMLCSNKPITQSLKPLAAISEHWSERRRQENDVAVRNHIEEQGKIIKHLDNELQQIKNIITDKQKEIDTIKAMPIWKVLRRVKKVLNK